MPNRTILHSGNVMVEIPGFSKYLACSSGNIWSLFTYRYLKPYVSQCYESVTLIQDNGQKIRKNVHRLIALAFLGQSTLQVNHKDGNKLNNHFSNLEYVTPSENAIHAINIGLRKTFVRGSCSGRSKLDEDDVIFIRELYKTGLFMQKEICAIFNISRESVRLLTNNKTWKHVKQPGGTYSE